MNAIYDSFPLKYVATWPRIAFGHDVHNNGVSIHRI